MSTQIQILIMVNFQHKYKKVGSNVTFVLPLNFDKLNFFKHLIKTKPWTCAKDDTHEFNINFPNSIIEHYKIIMIQN
jgi:hypothetical protein